MSIFEDLFESDCYTSWPHWRDDHDCCCTKAAGHRGNHRCSCGQVRVRFEDTEEAA